MTWRLVAALSATLLVLCDAPAVGGQPTSAGSFVGAGRTHEGVPDSGEVEVPERPSPPSPSVVSVWGAGSIRPGRVLGKIAEGWVGLVGLRYHRRLLPPPTEPSTEYDAPTLTYTADAVPLAAVSIPKGTPPGTPSSAIRSVKEAGLSTYGVGVYPIGLRVGFRPSATVRPYASGHTGLFYFSDPVPDERGRRLNFAAGIGAGVQIPLSSRSILILGYRYHHLSNGFRGSINPGLDANLLYLGLGVVP